MVYYLVCRHFGFWVALNNTSSV